METDSLSVGEAALSFLTSLPPEESKAKQQELNKFLLWYGKDRPVDKITPLEIETYAEWVGKGSGDAQKKLEPLREFLVYLKKSKYVKNSLATSVRTRKVPSKTRARVKPPKQEIVLTPEDYEKLKAQLVSLEEDRVNITQDIKRAAADKDFRENAPLHAASEQKAHIEARIRQIQQAITTGVLVQADEGKHENSIVRLGSKVTLHDVRSGVKLTYTLVTRNEADPARSKISIVSPIGKAILNQRLGEQVKVVAPVGELLYKIDCIE